MEPSIISGAGLTKIIREGKIGNAKVGKGEWLIIEADESDGSIVKYFPEIGLLLNIDKDHQEIEELMSIFTIFRNNTTSLFVTNQGNKLAATLSKEVSSDFSARPETATGYTSSSFKQEGMKISFNIRDQQFELNTVGKHNMENAVAAVCVAHQIGVGLDVCAAALKNYEGIYRRHQLLGIKNGVYVIDDYGHNPVKCASSIEACQPIAPKVIAWFQPHGYGPTRFLKSDFIEEFSKVLRPSDEIWMSEIFYAGGTATKDISSNDLIVEIQNKGCNAFFIENRNDFLDAVRPHLTDDCVLLLMGARDPGLEAFSQSVWQAL
jgi:UDP-N-acetylmuramate--alanine ligase